VHNPEKSLAAILAETKEELKQFIATRVEIFKAEMNERTITLKRVIPLILGGAMVLFAGWLTLTFALVALLHTMFISSVYSWFWAGLIVAAVYMLSGGILGWLGYKGLTTTGLKPTRTLEVLKQDQIWIQNEARTI
jgi:hypothetical protein